MTAPAPVDAEDATDTPPAAGPSALASVLRSAGARVLVLPISAVLGVVNTRLIIEHFGRDAFAQYGLLVAIGALLPFADLGMSAAIVNAVAGSDDPAHDDHVRRTLITSLRVLLVSAAVMVLVTLGISLVGAWEALLGDGLVPGSGPIAAALCLVAIAVSMPASFGQRILTGLGRNHVRVLLLGLQTPIVVVVVYLAARFDLVGGSYLAVVPYVSAFALSVAASVVAARLLRPTVRRALRDVPRVRSVRGARVLDVAWPMLVQLVAVPLAMQTDRIVLSHVTDVAALASYNLGAQLYLPVWQVVSAAGVALWPVFARARSRGGAQGSSPVPMAVGFGAAAAGVCLLISIGSPWLVELASDGQVDVPLGMLLAFSALMICQAAKYPLGIYMTDAAGLRYQAKMVALELPTNFGLSLLLAIHYGAVGPVIGSAIGVLCFELLANLRYVRRVRRAAPEAAT